MKACDALKIKKINSFCAKSNFIREAILDLDQLRISLFCIFDTLSRFAPHIKNEQTIGIQCVLFALHDIDCDID